MASIRADKPIPPYGDGSSRIFLTGDTHITGTDDVMKLSAERWPEGQSLTRDDYLIILGDFGAIFSAFPSEREISVITWLDEKPWTTLWIDGNHENFRRINNLDVVEWHGGKAHRVTENILHLMRGEIYNIAGLSFLTFGGGKSIDKYLRTPGLDWWKEELPNPDERGNCTANLIAHGDAVDVVLTHDAPAGAYYSVLNSLGYTPDGHSYWMDDNIRRACSFKRWYFGHLHCDAPDAYPLTPLYHEVVELSLEEPELPRGVVDEDGELIPDLEYEKLWQEAAPGE